MARPALTEEEIASFRDRLCEIATHRFAERGYAGVSLRGLARDLGCSPTTPYRYFDDKDEILAIVRVRAYEELQAYGCRALRRPGAPLERLERLGMAYLRFARENPHAYQIAFELFQPDAARFPALVRARAGAWQVIRDAVVLAIESGALAGNVDVVSHIFWAGMHGLVTLELAGQLQAGSLSKLSRPMIRALLAGVAAPRRGDCDD
jgi:AcrR family transcriptional regulator